MNILQGLCKSENLKRKKLKVLRKIHDFVWKNNTRVMDKDYRVSLYFKVERLWDCFFPQMCLWYYPFR